MSNPVVLLPERPAALADYLAGITAQVFGVRKSGAARGLADGTLLTGEVAAIPRRLADLLASRMAEQGSVALIAREAVRSTG